VITKQQIKYIRSLHQKKFRDEYNCFIAEGEKITNEAIITQPEEIDFIVCTPDAKANLSNDSSRSKLKIIEVSSNEFLRISGQKTPQGVLAVLRKKKRMRLSEDIEDSIVLALDRIQDPGNFGTILRLADWFNIHNILCSDDCVDVYNPKVVQSSMGAFLRVNLRYGRLNELLFELKAQGYSVYGTTLNGKNIYRTNFGNKTVIILGNESSGLSESILTLSDHQIRIPNFSVNNRRTESLNVAIAAGIICGEIRRREENATQSGTAE
jgi:TrmH family RNA methyltransferase